MLRTRLNLMTFAVVLAAPLTAGQAAHGAQAQGGGAAPGFILTSTTFEDGGFAPNRLAYTKGPDSPDCFGENVSPQLAWANPAPGVTSYALTMYEAEGGPAHTDLVVYGIPANITSFDEGELSRGSPKFVEGRGFRTIGTWRGMCPPANVGKSIHHYIFRIRGTDLDPRELPPGLTAGELDARLAGHAKGQAVLAAKYRRPQ
jgi:phosphatidylethanolamine-binding protein (PEBP) family uncharacterized protein